MKTSKPISTISYNSEKFLREKIFYWKKVGWIEYGMWILHQPDVDGDKAHYHVYLQPAKLIQTENLILESHEIDPSWKPLDTYVDDKEKDRHEKKKFLKMTVFKNSEPSNWILYGIHDESYLAGKGMIRNIHYEVNDIQATCDDTLLDMVSCAFDLRNNTLEFRLIKAIEEGKNWMQIVRSGMIPLRQINSALLFYRTLTQQIVDMPNGSFTGGRQQTEQEAENEEREIEEARKNYLKGQPAQRA